MDSTGDSIYHWLDNSTAMNSENNFVPDHSSGLMAEFLSHAKGDLNQWWRWRIKFLLDDNLVAEARSLLKEFENISSQ